ncbi:unnamed protein product, partial [Larinioides sclopetarius]
MDDTSDLGMSRKGIIFNTIFFFVDVFHQFLPICGFRYMVTCILIEFY